MNTNTKESLTLKLLKELHPEEVDILGEPTVLRIINGDKIQSEFEGGSNSPLTELILEVMRTAEFALLAVNIYLHFRESRQKTPPQISNNEFSDQIKRLRSQYPQITKEEEELIVKKLESFLDESN